jgi:hypothetical protein
MLLQRTGWLTLPTGHILLDQIMKIDGWLMQGEACALHHYALRAIRESSKESTMVEIGSYQGRSTISLALAVKIKKKAC